jgi:hypothetical protein
LPLDQLDAVAFRVARAILRDLGADEFIAVLPYNFLQTPAEETRRARRSPFAGRETGRPTRQIKQR